MREENDVFGAVVSQTAYHVVSPHSGSGFNVRRRVRTRAERCRPL